MAPARFVGEQSDWAPGLAHNRQVETGRSSGPRTTVRLQYGYSTLGCMLYSVPCSSVCRVYRLPFACVSVTRITPGGGRRGWRRGRLSGGRVTPLSGFAFIMGPTWALQPRMPRVAHPPEITGMPPVVGARVTVMPSAGMRGGEVWECIAVRKDGWKKVL